MTMLARRGDIFDLDIVDTGPTDRHDITTQRNLALSGEISDKETLRRRRGKRRFPFT
jgi:hypothetical protein